MHLRGIIDYLYFAGGPPNVTRLISLHITHGRCSDAKQRNKTETDREIGWNEEDGRVIVPAALDFAALWTPTQNVGIWRPGKETQQSDIFLLHWQMARTNRNDSTVRCNSLSAVLIQREAQFNLHRNGREKCASEGSFLLFELRGHFRAYGPFTWSVKFCFVHILVSEKVIVRGSL